LLLNDRTTGRIQHERRWPKRTQFGLSDEPFGFLGEGHSQNQKVEARQKFTFLARYEDPIGQDPPRVTRSIHNIDIFARVYSCLAQDVYPKAERICHARRFTTDSAVAPQSYSLAANLGLELR